jgi:hypothetical protein
MLPLVPQKNPSTSTPEENVAARGQMTERTER